MKYIVVSGGVVSGLGKGVTISSLGRMLRGCGLRVTSIKIDPYLNVDAGTMSPFEHGEVSFLPDINPVKYIISRASFVTFLGFCPWRWRRIRFGSRKLRTFPRHPTDFRS
jgi:hypothetical protein